MSDERKTFSLEFPAELLKPGLDSAEEPTTEKVSVTLQATREQGKLITALRQDLETYIRYEVDDSRSSVDRIVKVLEIRISFYDKLILLAGGCFALSLTLVAALQRHASQSTPLQGLGSLKFAWIFLLAGILFSWFHNLSLTTAADGAVGDLESSITSIRHEWASRLATRAAMLFKAMESQPMGEIEFFAAQIRMFEALSKKAKENQAEYQNILKPTSITIPIFASLSLLSIVLAFWFMIQFAIKNVGLL